MPAARAASGTTVTAPVYNESGHLIQTPFAPPGSTARLTKTQALAIVRAYPKVKAWLARYPKTGFTDEETYDPKTLSWTVKLWYGAAGEIVESRVDDASGVVLEAWTGPQVAWGMARGGPGAFGGTKINSYPVWLGLCAAFHLTELGVGTVTVVDRGPVAGASSGLSVGIIETQYLDPLAIELRVRLEHFCCSSWQSWCLPAWHLRPT